jgi:TIR domain
MSLLFVSHASEDKHRIKCITDALLGCSYKLWIDSPHLMGYTPDEVRGRIYHILGGRSWQEEIDAGIRAADCVILLASQRVLDQREVWRREVVTADYERKLITVRLDNVDLTKFGFGVEFARTQHVDIHLPEGHQGDLPELRKGDLEQLRRSLTTKLIHVRQRTFGDFEDAVAGRRAVHATREQLDTFLMMLDRDAETYKIARAQKSMSLVGADDTACPAPFKRRIPLVELPALYLPGEFEQRAHEIAKSRNVSKNLAAKALIVQGVADATHWQLQHIPWPGDQFDVDSTCQYFVERIMSLSGPSSEGHTPPLGSASANAARTGDRFFFYTTAIYTSARSCRRNAEVVQRLGPLLAGLSTDRVRLLVHVQPAVPRMLSFRKDRYAWLHEAARGAGLDKILVLTEVQLAHLEEWSVLMSLLFQTTEETVRAAVHSVFEKHKVMTMSLAALRERLEPLVASWSLRPLPTLAVADEAPVSSAPEEWCDA